MSLRETSKYDVKQLSFPAQQLRDLCFRKSWLRAHGVQEKAHASEELARHDSHGLRNIFNKSLAKAASFCNSLDIKQKVPFLE